MNDPAYQKIEEFIRGIQSVNSEHAQIVERVRDLFMDAERNLIQKIMYGGLVFFKDSALIGGVFPYTKHISIEFSNGADFSDPSSALEGNGKSRRHLKIYTAADVDNRDARFFIKQAVGK